jgi:membrane protease YdiL (CAAX protease family)
MMKQDHGSGVESEVSPTSQLRTGRIRTATYVGLFIAIALPLVAPLLPLIGPPSDPGVHTTEVSGLTAHFTVDPHAFAGFVASIQYDLIFKWSRSIALILLVIFWERESLSSIGLRKMLWSDALAVLAGFLLVFVTDRVIDSFLPRSVPNNVQLALMLLSFPLRAGMAVTAAVTEEIESRGYLLERLESITRSGFLAATLAFLLFVLGHASSWDIIHAFRIVPWTAVLIALYMWRRNLAACVLLHFLADARPLLAMTRIA